jgi:hypothetical protein
VLVWHAKPDSGEAGGNPTDGWFRGQSIVSPSTYPLGEQPPSTKASTCADAGMPRRSFSLFADARRRPPDSVEHGLGGGRRVVMARRKQRRTAASRRAGARRAAVGATLLVLSVLLISRPSLALADTWQTRFPSAAMGSELTSATLTPDGTDSHTLTQPDGHLIASAPATNSGLNLRQVVWPAHEIPLTDSEVCATWENESTNYAQEGLAVRIVSSTAGTRAVTVTKNVIYGINWIFNVHTWDSSNTSAPFNQIAQFDFGSILSDNGHLRALPWRTCIRTLGNQLSFNLTWLNFSA